MARPAARVTNDPTNYFAFALQSAKDVDGTTFYFTKNLDGTGFDTNPSYSSERVGGSGREIGLRYRTKVTADGQLVVYAQPDVAGRLLYSALGTDTVTAGASNPALQLYNHAINSGASLLPYYTVEQGWADEVERTGNCVVSDLKLEGEAGKPVKMTWQFVSGGTPHTQGTALTPVREGGFPLMIPGGSAAIVLAGSSYGAGAGYGIGASSLQVTKWSLDIKNALDDSVQTVALNREDVPWLTTDYDLDVTVMYVNNAIWNTIQYGQGSQVPTGLLENAQWFFYTATPSGTSLNLFMPFIEATALKVNRLDPDGKTMYLDATFSSRNIGTQSLQATVVSPAATVYSNTAT
jgi:hypothetical protein